MNRNLRPLSRVFFLSALALCVARGANAQPNGGGHGGPGGPGGPGDGPGGPGGGPELTVTSDGSALLVSRTSATSGTTTTVTFQLESISASGAKAWSWTAPSAIHDVTLVGSLAVIALGPASAPSSTATTPEPTTLVALNASTGAEAWRLTLGGVAGRLTAAGTRTLAVVSTFTAATSTTSASVSRSLVSVDAAGHVSWSVSLD